MYGLPKFPIVHWIFISHISIFLGWLKAALYQATRIWLRAEIRIWLQSAERTATFDAATLLWSGFGGRSVARKNALRWFKIAGWAPSRARVQFPNKKVAKRRWFMVDTMKKPN